MPFLGEIALLRGNIAACAARFLGAAALLGVAGAWLGAAALLGAAMMLRNQQMQCPCCLCRYLLMNCTIMQDAPQGSYQQQRLLQQLLPTATSTSDQSAVMTGALNLLLGAETLGLCAEIDDDADTEDDVMDTSGGIISQQEQDPCVSHQEDILIFFAENSIGKRRFAAVASTGQVVVTSGALCPQKLLMVFCIEQGRLVAPT
jgi:hypothetical protein